MERVDLKQNKRPRIHGAHHQRYVNPAEDLSTTRKNSGAQVLRVRPSKRFDYEEEETFSKPVVIGEFALDSNREYRHSCEKTFNYIPMHWWKDKKVAMDLDFAMDKVKHKNFEETKKEKLDRLLQWILYNSHRLYGNSDKNRPLENIFAKIVCFRGLLTEVMCTPFEDREGFIICATKFRGTIYLYAYETPEKIQDRRNQTERQQRMGSWGYKFEQYMTQGKDVNEGVDENEEYCAVFCTNIGQGLELLYGAEIDGADPANYDRKKGPPNNMDSFTELKTSKLIETDRDERTFRRFKIKKWWAQSYLVGVPTVVAGFRDEHGVVRQLKAFNTHDLPNVGSGHWKAHVMRNFLREFLRFVIREVQVDDPNVVYKFEREKNGGDIYCEFLGPDPEWTFLPEWYVSKIFSGQGNYEKLRAHNNHIKKAEIEKELKGE